MRFVSMLLVAFALSGAASAAVADMSRSAQALTAAMADVRAGDWRGAAIVAQSGGEIVRDIVEWQRLREGGQADFDAYRDFLARRSDWPGLDLLLNRGEGSIPETADPAEVLAYFGTRTPATGTGALRLLAAHAARGETGDEQALAVLAWRTMRLGAAAEDALLARYRDLLAAHHEERLDHLLWEGAWEEARRMYPRVSPDWVALAEARMGLAQQVPEVDARIAKVPERFAGHPGLVFERFHWRARKGRDAEAIALMRATSTRPEALGEPARWANWRRIYARQMMRAGDGEGAYALASRHFLLDGSDFADLEWLSGYLALRFLDDPELALFHFDRFAAEVESPISRGRAGYWRGRAYDALGAEAAADAAYAEGAQHQSSFYGLLAAEAAGLPLDPTLTGAEVFPAIPTTRLAGSSVLAAALLLREAGEPALAERFFTHLVEDLARPEAGALGALLLDLGEEHMALMVAKRAAARGIVLPAAYFPLAPEITGRKLPVATDLALAIARRESEFDPVVVSPAGARGLMQLMPGTARDVSAELGIPYDAPGLTGDPAYNVSLGTAYLAGLIESFGPAPILVAVGYNAGPRRSTAWVADRGDPRSAGTDIVDWIEMIPFRETQEYVMRVTESVYVYRARLTGQSGPVRFLDYLRAG